METKKCPKCEETKNVTEFYKSKQTKDGLKCYCKFCTKKDNNEREGRYGETRKTYRKSDKYRLIKKNYFTSNKEKILTSNALWRQTFKGKLLSYKRAAKKRDIEWLLTDEDFKLFWQQPCYYCGDVIETIGIDRIDNNKGYEISNCTPCCSVCNTMKMSMDTKEFLNKMKKILNNLKYD